MQNRTRSTIKGAKQLDVQFIHNMVGNVRMR